MNPQQNNSQNSDSTKTAHPVFQVTQASKYLALLLFILMPFIGGLIGYTYAPVQTVYIYETKFKTQEAPVTTGVVSLCGKEFALKNTHYVQGNDVAQQVAKLLTAEYEAENKSNTTSCYWLLENSEGVTELEVTARPARYDSTPITAASSSEAYLVKFMPAGEEDSLGEGNYIDNKTLEVFRVNTMDGSKGKSLGILGQ